MVLHITFGLVLFKTRGNVFLFVFSVISILYTVGPRTIKQEHCRPWLLLGILFAANLSQAFYASHNFS